MESFIVFILCQNCSLDNLLLLSFINVRAHYGAFFPFKYIASSMLVRFIPEKDKIVV